MLRTRIHQTILVRPELSASPVTHPTLVVAFCAPSASPVLAFARCLALPPAPPLTRSPWVARALSKSPAGQLIFATFRLYLQDHPAHKILDHEGCKKEITELLALEPELKKVWAETVTTNDHPGQDAFARSFFFAGACRPSWHHFQAFCRARYRPGTCEKREMKFFCSWTQRLRTLSRCTNSWLGLGCSPRPQWRAASCLGR